MAEAFSGQDQFPDAIRFQTSATPDELTEITLRGGAKRVSIQFIANAGKIAFDGVDAAAIGTEFITVAADSILELRVGSKAEIYVASASASVFCEIAVEEL